MKKEEVKQIIREIITEDLSRYSDAKNKPEFNEFKHGDLVASAEKMQELTERYFKNIEREFHKADPFIKMSLKGDLWNTIKQRFGQLKTV
jgi:hypothetical protein